MLNYCGILINLPWNVFGDIWPYPIVVIIVIVKSKDWKLKNKRNYFQNELNFLKFQMNLILVNYFNSIIKLRSNVSHHDSLLNYLWHNPIIVPVLSHVITRIQKIVTIDTFFAKFIDISCRIDYLPILIVVIDHKLL